MTLEGVLGPIKTASTNMGLVDAHVAHLRHLTKSTTAARMLQSRHAMRKPEARSAGRLVAAYVAQALEFHAASRLVSPSVHPVLQYYAYLNLATATILSYNAKSDSYRRHGISDTTHCIPNLGLSSKVAEFKRGAVPAFHQLLCGQDLRNTTVRLRDLVVAIPSVGSELEAAFDIQARVIRTSGTLMSTDGRGDQLTSMIRFESWDPTTGQDTIVPIRALESTIPLLQSKYRRKGSAGTTVDYHSRKSWPKSEGAAAKKAHRSALFRATNLGGRAGPPLLESRIDYLWRYVQRHPVFPTLSAGLVLSFVLASLYRYRPMQIEKLHDSRLHLLIDVFVNEADGFMLPGFRNLLYGEELLIEAVTSV